MFNKKYHTDELYVVLISEDNCIHEDNAPSLKELKSKCLKDKGNLRVTQIIDIDCDRDPIYKDLETGEIYCTLKIVNDDEIEMMKKRKIRLPVMRAVHWNQPLITYMNDKKVLKSDIREVADEIENKLKKEL